MIALRVTEPREGYEREGPRARRSDEVLTCGPLSLARPLDGAIKDYEHTSIYTRL